MSADVYDIYLLKADRLWNARGEAFFQIFGKYSSNILEFIPVIWNFGPVWVMCVAAVFGVVSNAMCLYDLTQVSWENLCKTPPKKRKLTQDLEILCQSYVIWAF